MAAREQPDVIRSLCPVRETASRMTILIRRTNRGVASFPAADHLDRSRGDQDQPARTPCALRSFHPSLRDGESEQARTRVISFAAGRVAFPGRFPRLGEHRMPRTRYETGARRNGRQETRWSRRPWSRLVRRSPQSAARQEESAADFRSRSLRLSQIACPARAGDVRAAEASTIGASPQSRVPMRRPAFQIHQEPNPHTG
jgi:hypothetical protein